SYRSLWQCWKKVDSIVVQPAMALKDGPDKTVREEPEDRAGKNYGAGFHLELKCYGGNNGNHGCAYAAESGSGERDAAIGSGGHPFESREQARLATEDLPQLGRECIGGGFSQRCRNRNQ